MSSPTPNWVLRLQRWPIGVVGEFLGTRASTDPQATAARRWLRKLFMVHAEQLALTKVLIDTGIVEAEAYEAALQQACQTLCKELEQTFPGLHAVDDGVHMDIAVARQTTKDWPK